MHEQGPDCRVTNRLRQHNRLGRNSFLERNPHSFMSYRNGYCAYRFPRPGSHLVKSCAQSQIPNSRSQSWVDASAILEHRMASAPPHGILQLLLGFYGVIVVVSIRLDAFVSNFALIMPAMFSRVGLHRSCAAKGLPRVRYATCDVLFLIEVSYCADLACAPLGAFISPFFICFCPSWLEPAFPYCPARQSCLT
jgi:hypothetical protein